MSDRSGTPNSRYVQNPTVNILAKIAHFFHSSKFWVSLIFPGFSRCFLAPRLWHGRYLCQKSYEKERNGAQRQNFCVFILQIGVNLLRTVRKVLKNSHFWLFLWSMWSLFPPGFQVFGEKLIFSTPPGGGANPARIFTVGELPLCICRFTYWQ